jgi:Flp pilus assembly protein TadD
MSTAQDSKTAFEQGRTLFGQGRLALAVEQFQAWIREHPQDARAHHDLSAAQMAMGQLEQAEAACTAAVGADPKFIQGWTSLATIQAARGQQGTPLQSMMRACRLQPHSTELQGRLGVLLLDHNHLDQAKRVFELVHRQVPGDLDSLSGLAMVLERMGKLEQAHSLLAPHIIDCPTHARMGLVWGAVCRRLGQPEAARPVLERMLSGDKLGKGGRMMMLYELGPILERLGEPEAAWSAVEAANRLQSGLFDPAALIEETDRLIHTFDRAALARMPRSTNTDPTPILIVGMPRSGTSLVEQILSAHPDVAPAGELSDLQAAAQLAAKALGRPWPECLEQMDTALSSRLGEWYLSRRRSAHPDAARVTDKMPQNFQLLGLAALILPGATFISCERNAQDVALSCFFQNFKAPLAWSYKLEWIRVYMEQHQRLMAHWQTAMPGRIHRIRYEDLVMDPEPQMRALLAASGLDWDPALLRHHRVQRTVHTASYAQATAPIYRTSVGRSAAFSKHLAGHFDELGDA